MAGLEADTSIYQMPVQKSPAEQAAQFQQLESQKLLVDRQKLENADKALGFMTRAMGSLGPDASKEQYASVAMNAVKMGLVPQNMLNSYMERLQAAPDSKAFYKEFMSAAMDHQQQIQFHIGQPDTQNDSANMYQGVRKPVMQGGGFVPSTSMPIQVPPTAEVQNPDQSKRLVGPSGPAGVQPYAAPPMPRSRPQMPVAGPATPAPATTGPTAPTANNGTEFNNRFSAAYPTGAAPGVVMAKEAVGGQSGKDYAADLARAKNYQQELYPSQRVLDIVKEQGPQAFGPGTEGLNTLKSALVTWLPNVDQKLIDGVSDYEQAKKYLVQAARSSGTTGTNDQLAAAFEANPNVKMSGATIENVVKSNIALRKMQHAQTILFGQQGLEPDKYSTWIAQNQNVLDPRAFGFDMMTNEAKKKLVESMAHKDNAGNWIANKGKEKEFKKFETSRMFAEDAGLIEPPARKQQ